MSVTYRGSFLIITAQLQVIGEHAVNQQIHSHKAKNQLKPNLSTFHSPYLIRSDTILLISLSEWCISNFQHFQTFVFFFIEMISLNTVHRSSDIYSLVETLYEGATRTWFKSTHLSGWLSAVFSNGSIWHYKVTSTCCHDTHNWVQVDPASLDHLSDVSPTCIGVNSVDWT